MVRTKIKHKSVIFEHFYFIMFGLLAILTSGIFIATQNLNIQTYFGFMGHGICYVAGLSYINIRMSKTQFRFVKLSIPHFMYLVGIGITNLILHSRQMDVKNFATDIAAPVGGTIAFFAFILFGAYIMAEVLRVNGRCGYKASLDEDVTVENNNGTILEHKFFPYVDDPNNEVTEIDEFDKQLEYSHLLFAIFTKCISIMHFYFPFFMIVQYISTNGLIIMSLNWISILGLIISILVLPFVKYRIHFVFACGLKVMALITFIVIFGEADDDLDDLLLFLTFYAVSAYGLSFPDINILSYANLKYNEIVLASGYVVEYGLIGIIQYLTLCHTKAILDYSNLLCLILPHSVRFIIIISLIGVIGVFKIPSGKLQKSLFELKNDLYNEKILVREYFHISYPPSHATSQIQLINDNMSSNEEFDVPKHQLYQDQQLVVQKRINDVLDEQEASCRGEPSTSFAADRKLELNIEV